MYGRLPNIIISGQKITIFFINLGQTDIRINKNIIVGFLKNNPLDFIISESRKTFFFINEIFERNPPQNKSFFKNYNFSEEGPDDNNPPAGIPFLIYLLEEDTESIILKIILFWRISRNIKDEKYKKIFKNLLRKYYSLFRKRLKKFNNKI